MRFFKLCWEVHRWTGVVAALFLAVLSVTGFLLLIKKDYAWIQPPTTADTAGEASAYLPLDEVYKRVFALGHAELRSEADIDRIDFRPSKRCYKVRAKSNDFEVQVGAVTGEILSVATRRSDWIERLHDGSLIAEWLHNWWMPMVAIGLFTLTLTGSYIFIWPYVRRWRRRGKPPRNAH